MRWRCQRASGLASLAGLWGLDIADLVLLTTPVLIYRGGRRERGSTAHAEGLRRSTDATELSVMYTQQCLALPRGRRATRPPPRPHSDRRSQLARHRGAASLDRPRVTYPGMSRVVKSVGTAGRKTTAPDLATVTAIAISAIAATLSSCSCASDVQTAVRAAGLIRIAVDLAPVSGVAAGANAATRAHFWIIPACMLTACRKPTAADLAPVTTVIVRASAATGACCSRAGDVETSVHSTDITTTVDLALVTDVAIGASAATFTGGPRASDVHSCMCTTGIAAADLAPVPDVAIVGASATACTS